MCIRDSSLALSAGEWDAVNNFVIFERKRPLTIVMLANNDDFFKNRLVDKTYSIVTDYFNTAANNAYILWLSWLKELKFLQFFH